MFESNENVYLIMELCEGGELFDRMSKGRLTEAQAALVTKQVLNGLLHLHSKHIAHCDLKPDNFMLMDMDSLDNLKIIDMGFAQKIKATKRLSQVCS
jgi:calcium-dependent protein kinase